MSCGLESQRYFESQKSAHAVTKEGDRIVNPSRRLHHRKDFVRQGRDTRKGRQAIPVSLSGVLDSDPLYVGGKLPGKWDIKCRVSTCMRENIQCGRGFAVVRTPVHRASVPWSTEGPTEHLHRHHECQRVRPRRYAVAGRVGKVAHVPAEMRDMPDTPVSPPPSQT